jgi:very-short-patch-repair endonuclease
MARLDVTCSLSGITQMGGARPAGVHPTITAIARRQHALISYGQLTGVISRSAVRNLRVTGELEPVRFGVYRVAGTPETWEQQVLSACLVAGDGAVASFRTAALIWGFAYTAADDPLEVTTPARRRARIPGVSVHDSFILDGWHTTRRRSIPVTSPTRTLCDLTAVWKPWDVERAVDDALRRKLFTLKRLEAVFLDLAHRGRRRSTVMRAALEARLPGFDPGDSDMETKVLQWISSAGLPKPVQQHRVTVDGHSYRLDLSYPDLKIAIEYDGWDAHSRRTSFDGDRARQNPLELMDWIVLRYTSRSTKKVTVAQVEQAIRLRTPSK